MGWHFATFAHLRAFSSSSSRPENHLYKTQALQNLLKSGFSPTLPALNHLLLFLSRSNRFQTLLYIWSQMISNHIQPSPATLSIVSDSLLQHSTAQDQFEKFGILAQNRVFDSLVRHVSRVEKNPEKAACLLHCLRSFGISPSLPSLYSLVFCFSEFGMMDKAMEVVEVMVGKNQGWVIDNFVCSSMMTGFCSTGKPDLAFEFYSNARKFETFKPNVVTYTALVNVLCYASRLREVCGIVAKMEEEGIMFDEIFYSSWICGFLKEGCLMEAFKKHLLMIRGGITPDVVSYTILIDGLSKGGSVEKVIGLLNEMNRRGLEPNLVTYTAIMRGLIKRGNIENAFLVFRKMEELGIEMDEVVYGTLMDGLCQEGDLDQAFSLLEEMKQKNITANNVIYNTIINGLCKIGRTCDADKVSKTIFGDKFTYTTLVHGYIKEGNIVELLGTMQRSEKAGVHLDHAMCNVFIKALFTVGAFEDAYMLFKRMSGMGLVSNLVTYCLVIDGCCKVGKLDRVLEIFDDYRRNSNVSSNIVGYNCIIRGLCQVGMVDVAIKVFTELIESGISLDSVIYMSLVEAKFRESGEDGILEFLQGIGTSKAQLVCNLYNDGLMFLCQKGCSRAASDLYIFMRKKALNVTSESYTSILRGVICSGNTELVQLMLNAYLEEHDLFYPSIRHTLACHMCKQDVKQLLRFIDAIGKKRMSSSISMAIVNALTKQGRLQDAHKLVWESDDNGMFLDVIAYSVVIDGLCTQGYIEKALDLCIKMKQKNIHPNIFTYNIVIRGLCQQGCLVEAFRLFDSLEKINVFPTTITYSTLIGALCAEGFLDDAKELLSRMVLKGLSPNTRVYNFLISGYCRFGSLDKAFDLLLNLERNNLLPDSFTISSIVGGCCAKGDVEGAFGFYTQYRNREIFPDLLGFLSLIRGFCFKGGMEEARTVLREMLQIPSVTELIDKAGDQHQIDSLASFLGSLSDEGRIEEAAKVLNEIASIFFQLRRHTGTRMELQERISLECTDNNAVEGYGPLQSDGNSRRRQLPHDFDSWYDTISSFCSTGELQKANGMAKEMLLSF